MSVNRLSEETIFHEALEILSPEERAAYLARVCGDDRPLRKSVEQLLRLREKADDFLESPPVEYAWSDDQSVAIEGPGKIVGRYMLMQKIGEGGFGSVYMAKQHGPVPRKVALKIIKLGMNTREVIARFEAERQALALMDHPCISKVLDAGSTESGRPYFVMELIDGQSLTEYCDGHNLPVRERLRLFIVICNAIDHAHMRSVVHRDIKPSNVLVTVRDGEPIPQVIDFGIAKATQRSLEEETAVTQTGQFVGTPQYMSPEQADISPRDVGPRSDIYSLGVLLYELLTGTTPFAPEQLLSAGVDEMRRIIREEEPSRPSARLRNLGDTVADVASHRDTHPDTLSRTVAGDLDWITLKALEKEPGSRYATARELADDVQNFLESRPIRARRPSWFHHFAIWSRRHERLVWSIGSTAAIVLCLVAVGSALMAAKQSEIANQERMLADQERQRRASAERATERETALLVASYMDRAQSLCEQGEIGRGMIWLARCLEEAPQNATDLQHAARANLAVWSRHLHRLRMVVHLQGDVQSVTFTPDGSRIVAGCRDGTVWFSDVRTGQPVDGPLRLDESVVAVAASPDGSRFVTGTREGNVQLWDAATLEPVGPVLEHVGSIAGVDFSPDSTQLLTGSSGGTVARWNATTGEPIETFQHEGEDRYIVQALTFVSPLSQNSAGATSSDGSQTDGAEIPAVRILVTTEFLSHDLLDGVGGQPVGPPIKGFTRAVAISSDGSRVVTVQRPSIIHVWDTTTGELAIDPITQGGLVDAVAFSPDGTRLVSGGNTRAAVMWDTETGDAIGAPLRQQTTVRAVDFSPDGRRVVTGNADGVVRVWDVGPNKPQVQTLRHRDTIASAAFGPNGLCFLTERDGKSQLRDAETGKPIGQPLSHPAGWVGNKMVFSPDGKSLLTKRWFSSHLWHVATGKYLGQVSHFHVHGDAFSPDGSRLLSGGQDGTARLWDLATGRLAPLGPPLPHGAWDAPDRGASFTVHSVCFSPDGSRMLTGSYCGTTRLWNAATLSPIGGPLVHQSEVKSLAYSPDGSRFLIGFADGTVRLFNAATLEPIGPSLQHRDIVCSVALSGDGTRLATCSVDHTTRLWDVATLKPLGPALKHVGMWSHASFSPDGAEVLVGPAGGQFLLWQIPSGPLGGEIPRIVMWTQVVTGLELDRRGGILVLDPQKWQQYNQRLRRMGGAPRPSPSASRPGIVYTDFARSMERAVGGRDHAQQGQWDRATSEFAAAIRLSGDSPTLRAQIANWCSHWSEERMDNPVNLVGTAVDGKEFALEACRGKVVLIVFWNGPSPSVQTALASVGKNYRLYRDRGLEVVGVCVNRPQEKDAQPDLAEWVTLSADQVEQLHPALKCLSLADDARMVLVDRQGRLISAEVCDQDLDLLLHRHLGPSQAPTDQLICLDLQSKTNTDLASNLHFDAIPGSTGGGDHFGELPQGQQSFGGISFHVDKSLIQLASQHIPDEQERVTDIPVNRKIARLYALHGERTSEVPDGTVIGHYHVHYQDGSLEKIAIVYGQDLRHWWNTDNSNPVTRGQLVWIGSSPGLRRHDMTLRLYLMTWENPHPSKNVIHVDYSTTLSEAAPCCIAITVEEAFGEN